MATPGQGFPGIPQAFEVTFSGLEDAWLFTAGGSSACYPSAPPPRSIGGILFYPSAIIPLSSMNGAPTYIDTGTFYWDGCLWVQADLSNTASGGSRCTAGVLSPLSMRWDVRFSVGQGVAGGTVVPVNLTIRLEILGGLVFVPTAADMPAAAQNAAGYPFIDCAGFSFQDIEFPMGATGQLDWITPPVSPDPQAVLVPFF